MTGGGVHLDATRCKQNIVVALDASGSMAGGRFDAVKRGFAHLASNLSQEDNMHLLAFNTQVRPLSDGFETLTPATATRLVHRVFGLRAEGKTELFRVTTASVTQVLQLALTTQLVAQATDQSPGRFTVVVLTDGADTSQNKAANLQEACETLSQLNEHLGPGSQLASAIGAGDQGLLRVRFLGVALDADARHDVGRLVAAGGRSAEYFQVRDAAGIAGAFQEVVVRIRQDRDDLARRLVSLLEDLSKKDRSTPSLAADDDEPWPGLIQRGSHVRCVGTTHGAGGVSIGDVGVVTNRDTGRYVVDFPRADGWVAASSGDVILDEEAELVRPGAVVAIKSGITPLGGWGDARPNMRGFVVDVAHDGRVRVQLGLTAAGSAMDAVWNTQLSELVAIRPDESRQLAPARANHLPGPLQVGDAVRVKLSLQEPSTGWGSVTRGSVGYVRAFSAALGIYVCDFPEQDGVRFREADIEVEAIANRVRPGQQVRVRPTVDTPVRGWGCATRTSVGVVTKIDRDADPVIVQFGAGAANRWSGKLSELEVASGGPATTRDRDPDGINCRMLHGLAQFTTPHDGHACDFCGREGFPAGETMYGCRVCDVDACASCVARRQGGSRQGTGTRQGTQGTRQGTQGSRQLAVVDPFRHDVGEHCGLLSAGGDDWTVEFASGRVLQINPEKLRVLDGTRVIVTGTGRPDINGNSGYVCGFDSEKKRNHVAVDADVTVSLKTVNLRLAPA